MNLYLDNIGVIRDSNFIIEGITVVTGLNNSGKTTIGRVLYALISAVDNLVPRALADKTAYIIRGIRYGIYQFVPANIYREEENFNMGNSLSKQYIELIKNMEAAEPGQAKEIIAQAKDFYSNILKASDDSLYGMYKDSVKDVYGRVIVERKNGDKFAGELNSLDAYLQMLSEDPEALEYADRRIASSLLTEFFSQITPLRYRDKTGIIKLQNESGTFDVSIKNNKIQNIGHLYQPEAGKKGFSACMIDEAQDLDGIIESRRRRKPVVNIGGLPQERAFYQQILADSHKEELSRLLLSNGSTYSYIVAEDKAKAVLSKIHTAFDDRIIFDRGSLICAEKKLDVRNLAAGSKMFAMINQLIINGVMNDRTILILDEPDSHLHPEWQLLLAEIFYLLNRDLGVTILLTTHSLDFLYAMEVFQREYRTKWRVYDNIMQEDDYSVIFSEATNDLKRVYAKLGNPFQEMRRREMSDGRN